MVKKQRKMSKLTLQRETLRDLVTGTLGYYNERLTINNTVYSGQVGCRPVSDTCQSNCVCDA